MVIRLFNGFSTRDTGYLYGTAQANNGSSVVSWRADGQFFIPFGVTGFASGTFQYSGAVDRLQDDLNDLSLTVPKTVFEVRYDNSINRIVISSSRAAYHLTFNASAQRTFGLDSDYYSPQSKIITGSKAPFFVWTSTQESRARDTHVYEQDSFVKERVSDSGIAYGIGRRTVEKRRDWDFVLEPKSNVFAYASSALEPYNWERFIKNLREYPNPFILMEDVTASTIYYDDREALYEMRAEAMTFSPKPVSDVDYHEYWTLPVRTRVHFPRHRDRKENSPGVQPVYPGLTTLLLPIIGVTQSGVGSGEGVLSWSQASNASYYNIFLGQDSTPDLGEFIGSTTNNYYAFSGLTPVGNYFWKIQAVNDNGTTESEIGEFYHGGEPMLINDIDNIVTSTVYITGNGGYTTPQTYAQITNTTIGTYVLPIESFGESSGLQTVQYVLVGGGDHGFIGTVGNNYYGDGGGGGEVLTGSVLVSSSADLTVGRGGTYTTYDAGETAFYGITASGGNNSAAGNGIYGGGSSATSAGGGGGGDGGAGENSIPSNGGDGGAGTWVVFNEISQALAGGGGGAGSVTRGFGTAGGGNGALGAGPTNGGGASSYGGGGGGGIGLTSTGGDGYQGIGLLKFFIGPVLPLTATNPTPADTAVSISISQSFLYWSASLYSEKYEVYFDSSSPPSTLLGTTTDTSISLASEIPLTTSSSYYWRVDPVNTNGTSSGDVWEFMTFISACNLPGTVSNPTPATGVSGVSVDLTELSWSASTDTVSYNVYFDTVNPPVSQAGNTTALTWSLASETPLASTSSYFWQIDSINTCGTSSGDVYDFYTALSGAADWIVATGGTVVTTSISGTNYAIHSFTSTGTGSFVVDSVGATQDTVEYLVVAGGGGGSVVGGGGGAGGMVTGSATVTATTYTIVVGAGGAAVPLNSGGSFNGENSYFGAFATAISGAGGENSNNPGPNNGGSGGGGNQRATNPPDPGGAGVPGQGFDGGSGSVGGTNNTRAGGGGGGAGSLGGNATGGVGGVGGTGKVSGITGTDTYYAGGGGGWGRNGDPFAGGTGGGGQGGGDNSSAGSGSNGLGGGGGGGEEAQGGSGAGGSGIVIIRYPIE